MKISKRITQLAKPKTQSDCNIKKHSISIDKPNKSIK